VERTLFFLKPDAVVRQHVGATVLQQIVRLGCEPRAFARLRPSRHFLASEHYYMHDGKPFFDWLLDFITSENLVVVILEGNRIIPKIRQALGSATVEKAVLENPTSLRAQYGLFRGVNLAHASDSESSALHEVKAWSSNFGLRDDDHAVENLESYVSQNLECGYVETSLYRRVAERLEKNRESVAKAKKEVLTLLRRENTTLDTGGLEHFIEVALAAIEPRVV
jgi:nucleoside-diphosphate kinase